MSLVRYSGQRGFLPVTSDEFVRTTRINGQCTTHQRRDYFVMRTYSTITGRTVKLNVVVDPNYQRLPNISAYTFHLSDQVHPISDFFLFPLLFLEHFLPFHGIVCSPLLLLRRFQRLASCTVEVRNNGRSLTKYSRCASDSLDKANPPTGHRYA